MSKEIISSALIPLISALKDEVERVFSGKVETAKDFELLSESIFAITGQTISSTTLKRMWGYINEPKEPRRSTLDLLSRYSGWTDFDHFVSGIGVSVESGPVGTKTLHPSQELKRGDKVRLFWNPGRMCEIEYLGNDNWRVTDSVATRLKKGDTFRCTLISEGEPLYLEHLVKEGKRMPVYVCGREHGVSFVIN